MRCIFSILLTILFLTGCSRLPEPVGYDYSVQQKLQSAYHWEVLADDVANQINKELIRSDFIDTPVFVKETCGDDTIPCKKDQTPTFNESFRDLLVTRLVSLGIPTAAVPGNGSLTINYKAQLVYHATDRLRGYKPGNITLLATGIAVLRNAPTALMTIGLGGALDLANASYVKSGHYEVVITTSMVERDAYIFRQSDIYYINDQDFWHYVADETEAGSIEMTKTYFSKSSTAKAEEPVADISVTAEPDEILPEIMEEASPKNNSTDI